MGRLCLYIVVLLLAGCSASKYVKLVELTQAELLSGSILFDIDISEVPLPEVDVLALDDDMLSFLDQYVARNGSKEQQLSSLVSAMQEQGLMNLKYDADTTLTARETFQKKTGNCLSYTNLFVALAREVGLSVSYQQVDVPPSWSRSGDYVVLNRHINVSVDKLRRANYVVDFNLADYSGNYNTTRVDDNSAIAQYYSNIGVTHLKKSDYFTAFRYFKKALLTDANQSAIWVNLGVLYSGNDQFRYAEAAYFYALKKNPRNHTAHNNLVQLYEHRGDEEKSKYFRGRLNHYRDANPYYYLGLAKQQYAGNKFDGSIKNLKLALKKKNDEHLFYFWTGLNYCKLGDLDNAKRFFDQTLKYAYLSGTRERYEKQFSLLLSQCAV